MSRDIYVVSVPRDLRRQDGPLSPTPSRWRKLTRAQVRRAIENIVRRSLSPVCTVFIETRAETARFYQLSIRGVRLSAAGRRSRRKS